MSLHSIESEQSVIGGLLIDNSRIEDIAAMLTIDDFAFPESRAVYGAIINQFKQSGSADLVTVTERLESHGAEYSLDFIAEAMRNTPSAANIAAYANTVVELSQRREIIQRAREISETAEDRSRGVDDLILSSAGRFESIRRVAAEQTLAVGKYLQDEFLEPLDAKYNGQVEPMGLSYGLSELDQVTLGLHPGDLTIVGGRPSMGKTTFINGIVRANLQSCIDRNMPMIDFSLEMPRAKRLSGIIASTANIPLAALKNPTPASMTDEYFARLPYPISLLKSAPVYINETPSQSIDQIRAEVKRIHGIYGQVGIVLIDYLGCIRHQQRTGQRSDQAIGETVQGAKNIAKEFNCPVVLLSQLNRSLEQRTNKRPVNADLKDSGDIEAIADTILFLYRDEYYNRENPENKGLAEIIIGKSREGETGTIHCAARLSHGRFEDLAPRHYAEDAA